jgi:hypothetical protein
MGQPSPGAGLSIPTFRQHTPATIKGRGRAWIVVGVVLGSLMVLCVGVVMIGALMGSTEQPQVGAAGTTDAPCSSTLSDEEAVRRDPERHKGACGVLYIVVTQADANTGPCTFMASWSMAPDAESTDVALFAGEPCDIASAVKEGESYKIEVVVAGEVTYDTVLGGRNTVPKFTVTKVEPVA